MDTLRKLLRNAWVLLRPFMKMLYVAVGVFLLPRLQKGTVVGTFNRLSIKMHWIDASFSYWLLLIFALVYAYFLLQCVDRNDEKSIKEYLASHHPGHLLGLPSHLAEYIFGGLLSSISLGAAIAPLLPEIVPQPFVLLFGCVLFWMLRPLQLLLTRHYFEDQGRLGKEREAIPVPGGIINALALLALLLAIPYLLVVLVAFLFEIFFVFSLRLFYFVVFIFLIFAALFLWRRIRRILHRRKFLKRLEGMEAAGLFTHERFGHPYLSLFFNRLSFELIIKDRKGRTFSISVLSCASHGRPLRLREDSCFFIHGIPIRGTSGRWSAYAALECHYLFEFQSVYELRFPTEEEGRKILLIDPPPRDIRVVEGKASRPVDNGDRFWDYTVYSKNAFLNYLERDLTGSNQ